MIYKCHCCPYYNNASGSSCLNIFHLVIVVSSTHPFHHYYSMSYHDFMFVICVYILQLFVVCHWKLFMPQLIIHLYMFSIVGGILSLYTRICVCHYCFLCFVILWFNFGQSCCSRVAINVTCQHNYCNIFQFTVPSLSLTAKQNAVKPHPSNYQCKQCCVVYLVRLHIWCIDLPAFKLPQA